MEISSQPPLAQTLEMQRLIIHKKAQTAEAAQALTIIETMRQQQQQAAAYQTTQPASSSSSLFQQFA